MNPNSPDRLMIETIGHELVADASAAQRDEIWEAIYQDEAGVRRIASQIRTNPNVQRPIPLLLSKLRAGAHLTPSRERDADLSRIEIAYRLYEHKRADGVDETTAITYAIDYAPSGDSDIENELRERLGLPLVDQTPASIDEAARWLAINNAILTLPRDHPLRVAVRECVGVIKATDLLPHLEVIAQASGVNLSARATRVPDLFDDVVPKRKPIDPDDAPIVEHEPIDFAAAIPAIRAARQCDPEPDDDDDAPITASRP